MRGIEQDKGNGREICNKVVFHFFRVTLNGARPLAAWASPRVEQLSAIGELVLRCFLVVFKIIADEIVFPVL